MVVLTGVELLKTHVMDDPVVACAMCGAHVAVSKVTPGSLYADGSQAFACTIHLLKERRQWIVFWAAFDEAQREAAQQSGAAQ